MKMPEYPHLDHEPIDFELHGLVGIRLLGPTPHDAAAVAGQLGLPPNRPVRHPDIVIRFVDRLPISSPVRSVGLDDAGFTDDAFLILRAAHKSRVRVQIPFDQIGRRCEIVCESGVPAVPLLIDIVNLMMLGKGVVPIHASAFLYQGIGVLAVGWSQGGKTEALLSFMANGARYVGDEWVYVSRDARTMWGIPEPIRVWDWHLRTLPQFRECLPGRSLARLRLIQWANSAHRLLSGGLGTRRSSMFRRVEALLDRQLAVDVPPQDLFGDAYCSEPAPFDRLLLTVSHDSDDVEVRPIQPSEVAARMVFSLSEERSRLASYYRKFRFAFPGVVNPLLELADDLHGRMLSQVLEKKPAHVVYHPYPMQLPDFFNAVSPLLHGACSDSQPQLENTPSEIRNEARQEDVH